MTDERIAREAAKKLLVAKFAGGPQNLGSWVSASIGEPATASTIKSLMRIEAYRRLIDGVVVPIILDAIARSRQVLPAPSPVSAERLEDIVELAGDGRKHVEWMKSIKEAIDDLLIHINHQNALIAWLASEGDDGGAMEALREAVKENERR